MQAHPGECPNLNRVVQNRLVHGRTLRQRSNHLRVPETLLQDLNQANLVFLHILPNPPFHIDVLHCRVQKDEQ